MRRYLVVTWDMIVWTRSFGFYQPCRTRANERAQNIYDYLKCFIIAVIVKIKNCNLFTAEHLGVHKNSLKRVRAFLIELEFGSVGLRRGENRSTRGEKPLRAKERTNNKLNPLGKHVASTPLLEPGPHCLEASALTSSHQCAPFLPNRANYRSFSSHDITEAIFVYKTMNRQPCLCTKKSCGNWTLFTC